MAANEPIGDNALPKRTRTFRKYEPRVRFTPHQAQRQNLLIRRSWEALGSREAVIAFLNTSNEEIGGGPLALALASEDGLRSAERLLEDYVHSATLR